MNFRALSLQALTFKLKLNMSVTTRSDQVTHDRIQNILNFMDNNKIKGNATIPFVEEIVTVLSSKSGQVFINKPKHLDFRTILINKFAVEFPKTVPKISRRWYQRIFKKPLVVAEPDFEDKPSGGGAAKIDDESVQNKIVEDVEWWIDMQGDGPVFMSFMVELIQTVNQFLEDMRNITSKRIAIEIVKDIAQKLGSSDGQDVLNLYPKFKNYMKKELYSEYKENQLSELEDWWFIMFRCEIKFDLSKIIK